MNSNFWKRFPTIPNFDCMKMKHDIQTKIHKATKDMTQEQRLEYYRNEAKKLRHCKHLKSQHDRSLFVKEESVSYGIKQSKKN